MEFTADDVFDELSVILDPEKAPITLAELGVVRREGIKVTQLRPRRARVDVDLVPTVPHCHLMPAIALSVRAKLHLSLPVTTYWQVVIHVPEGSHLQAREVERQVNDKERVAAALENETVMREIRRFIREDDV
jgi:metal-sulfur cluster biosynthetic enzyme